MYYFVSQTNEANDMLGTFSSIFDKGMCEPNTYIGKELT